MNLKQLIRTTELSVVDGILIICKTFSVLFYSGLVNQPPQTYFSGAVEALDFSKNVFKKQVPLLAGVQVKE